MLRPAVSCCLSAAGIRFLDTLSCQTGFRPHCCRPTAAGAHTRTPATDPGRVYTFPTRETRTGPGSGSPNALLRRGPLRTGLARFPGISAQASPTGL